MPWKKYRKMDEKLRFVLTTCLANLKEHELAMLVPAQSRSLLH